MKLDVRILNKKTYVYLIKDYNDCCYDKEKIINRKVKGTKKCATKRRLMLENYKYCLFDDKTILKPQQRFKSDHHEINIQQVNKTVLSSDADKRIQTFNRTTTYPHGTNAFKVCESEMLKVCKAKAILKMLSKECEREIYMKEEEKCEMFLKYLQ